MPVRFEEETPSKVRFEEEAEDTTTSKVPWETSALYGAGQGVSFGYADEAIAGAKSLYDKATQGGDLRDLYSKRVDAERKSLDAARQANPGSYLGGNIAGALPTMAIPGLGIARGANLGVSLAKAGVQGGLMASGETTANPITDTANFAADTAKGAAWGAGTQGVASLAGRALSAMTPSALRKTAEERAVKAVTGQNISALRKMTNTTLRDAGDIEKANAGIRKVGRDILDEPGVLMAADQVEDIAPRLAATRKDYGGKIGEVAETIDRVSPGAVDNRAIAQNILNYAQTIPDTEAGKKMKDRLLAEAANFEKLQGLGFKDAQAFKNQFGYKPVDADALISNQDVTNKIQGIISKEMETTADRLSKSGPEDVKQLLANYQNLKSKYGSFKNASSAATDRVQKNLTNRYISPSDYASGIGIGGVGALSGTGSPDESKAQYLVLGALGALANKVGRTRGSSLAAKTADSIASAMEKSPLAAQEFGQLIIDAAKRGPAALTATHHILMKRPEYKAHFEEDQP